MFGGRYSQERVWRSRRYAMLDITVAGNGSGARYCIVGCLRFSLIDS